MQGSAIPEPHLSFYYNRYFKKQLNPGTFGLKNTTVSWIASGMKYENPGQVENVEWQMNGRVGGVIQASYPGRGRWKD